jgi:hypothetical protein
MFSCCHYNDRTSASSSSPATVTMGSWSSRFDDWLSYDSVRFIRVKNWRLGTAFWSMRMAILLYVVVYSVILEKVHIDHSLIDKWRCNDDYDE